MEKATIIGIDLAKRVFQVHGATQEGRPVFRKKVSRAQLLGFLAKQSPAVVAMERADQDTTMAKRVLKILEKALAVHIADRDRLTKRLAQTPR
jgi:transposase